MHKLFNPSVSIEEFAAFLDGNLTPNHMQEIAMDIQDDPMLQKISTMSDSVDDALEQYEIHGIDIPDNIMRDTYEIPEIVMPESLDNEPIEDTSINTFEFAFASCAESEAHLTLNESEIADTQQEELSKTELIEDNTMTYLDSSSISGGNSELGLDGVEPIEILNDDIE